MPKYILRLYLILSKHKYIDNFLLLIISLSTSLADIVAILIIGYFLSALTGVEIHSNYFFILYQKRDPVSRYFLFSYRFTSLLKLYYCLGWDVV